MEKKLLSDLKALELIKISRKICTNPNWHIIGPYLQKGNFVVTRQSLTAQFPLKGDDFLCEELLRQLAEHLITIDELVAALESPDIGLKAAASYIRKEYLPGSSESKSQTVVTKEATPTTPSTNILATNNPANRTIIHDPVFLVEGKDKISNYVLDIALLLKQCQAFGQEMNQLYARLQEEEFTEAMKNELAQKLKHFFADLYSILDYLMYTIYCFHENDKQMCILDDAQFLNFLVKKDGLKSKAPGIRNYNLQRKLYEENLKEVAKWVNQRFKKMDESVKDLFIKDLYALQYTVQVGIDGEEITPTLYQYEYEDQRSLITLHWLRSTQNLRFLIHVVANVPVNTNAGNWQLAPKPIPEGWQKFAALRHVTGLFILIPAFSNESRNKIMSAPLLSQVHQLLGFVAKTTGKFMKFYLGPYETAFKNVMDKKI